MDNLSEKDAPHRAERVLPLSGEANEAPESEDPSSFDTQERAFVWRLDLLFLTVGFLGYTVKSIAQ
ncbi:putative Major facilitator superfamily (MFS) profile domain-containing protein [Seiridium cardinale]